MINRRWTPMDADDPDELLVLGFLRAIVGITIGTTNTNTTLIGVHRRPSAVNLLLT